MKSEGCKERDAKRYRLWLTGKADRQAGTGAKSANGTYLDGFYSESAYPGFLTSSEAAEVRKYMHENNI